MSEREQSLNYISRLAEMRGRLERQERLQDLSGVTDKINKVDEQLTIEERMMLGIFGGKKADEGGKALLSALMGRERFKDFMEMPNPPTIKPEALASEEQITSLFAKCDMISHWLEENGIDMTGELATEENETVIGYTTQAGDLIWNSYLIEQDEDADFDNFDGLTLSVNTEEAHIWYSNGSALEITFKPEGNEPPVVYGNWQMYDITSEEFEILSDVIDKKIISQLPNFPHTSPVTKV